MAMNKRELGQISDVKNRLEEAINYLKDEKLFVVKEYDTCMKEDKFFNQANGKTYCSVNKHYGSNLAQLYTAKDNLESLLK